MIIKNDVIHENEISFRSDVPPKSHTHSLSQIKHSTPTYIFFNILFCVLLFGLRYFGGEIRILSLHLQLTASGPFCGGKSVWKMPNSMTKRPVQFSVVTYGHLNDLKYSVVKWLFASSPDINADFLIVL